MYNNKVQFNQFITVPQGSSVVQVKHVLFNQFYLSFLMLRECYCSINVSHIIQTNYYLHTQTSTDESFLLT